MKTIHLLRHAKSCWDDTSLADDKRPLNARGVKSCKIMAPLIVQAGCDFKRVYVSPAIRAQSTINGVLNELAAPLQWRTTKALYCFDVDELLAWVRQVDDGINTMMVVAHNPAITDLCNLLGNEYIDNVPTCAYVQLHCEVDSWQQLDENCAVVTHFITPKVGQMI